MARYIARAWPVLLCVILGAWSSSSASPPSTHSFKVLVIAPFTGPLAEYGRATRNGIEFAIKEHPELFQHISFTYEDSHHSSETALASFRKSHSTGDLSLAYIFGSGALKTIVPLSESAKVPIVGVSAKRSTFTGTKYTIRFGADLETIADIIWEYLRRRDLRHIVGVATDLDEVTGVIEAMQARAKERESFEVLQTFALTHSDFTQIAKTLRKRKAEATAVFLVGDQLRHFYRENKELMHGTEGIGTELCTDLQELKDSQMSVARTHYPAVLGDLYAMGRYHKEYGNSDHIDWAIYSHEFALLSAKLFGNSETKLNAEQIMDRFRGATQVEGTFAAFGYSSDPVSPGFDFKYQMWSPLPNCEE